MTRGLRPILLALAVVCQLLLCGTGAYAQAPVEYRLSFPEPEHRWMQVEVTFPDLPAGPFELHMSRSSPGRYALHEFAKNVSELRATDTAGAALRLEPYGPSRWRITEHPSTVRVSYRVFGDRMDGTFLAIDSSHAHVNMPAALVWAAGLDRRAARVQFVRPGEGGWQVATQLFPTADPLTFTAPNLQYLMDSPSEFGTFELRTFSVGAASFRMAVHHDGTPQEVEAFARDAEKVVREAGAVFGELAPYDGGTYTFIADYLPWAARDGMEHRNSTIMTSGGSLRSTRDDLLGTLSHEFFHSWNVERIRPRTLEPFDLDDVNVSGELWLAEGFTNYYGPLVLARAGLQSLRDFTAEVGGMIVETITSPGRRVRSLEEMSRMAPFVDAATSMDRTDFPNSFLSYYTWGGALGTGLDLMLRERSDGRVTLDAVMRALWVQHGRSAAREPGYVDRPYSVDDVRRVLAEVSGDAAFAESVVTRFIQGRELPDYEHLLGLAGLLLRRARPGVASLGDLRLNDAEGGAQVAALVTPGTPAYDAGLEREDVIVGLGGAVVRRAADVSRLLVGMRPGATVALVYERRGQRLTRQVRLVESDLLEVVTFEEAGRPLSDAQRRFRAAWLSSPAGNAL